MIVATNTKGRWTSFTSRLAPGEAGAVVVAVHRVVYAIEIARGVAIAVDQALLLDIVAKVGAFIGQCIVSMI